MDGTDVCPVASVLLCSPKLKFHTLQDRQFLVLNLGQGTLFQLV